MEFGNEISNCILDRIRDFSYVLEKTNIPWCKEFVPSFRAILFYYDANKINFEEAKKELSKLEKGVHKIKITPPRIVHLPIVFGGKYGPDLEKVAKVHNLTTRQVIDFFIQEDYRVCFIAFAPGLPYNAGLPKQLETPRLKTPRLKNLAGSVGIGGKQVCIHPIDSPGGYNIIGRTPIKFYDFKKINQGNFKNFCEVVFFRIGDILKFEPVEEGEFKSIYQAVLQDQYEVKIEY